MFASTRLGRFFGIDFYVHGTFWLLPLLTLVSGTLSDGLDAATFDVAVLLTLFGCVGLHEVGHALAARYYGIRTRDITLYPVGGVARLERMPERPWQEIVVALAGPAVNLVIAVGLFVGLVGVRFAVPLAWSPRHLTAPELFGWQVMAGNVGLLLFNLIPCFPMDGGRVLRAVLAVPLGRLRATEVAAQVSLILAAVFFLTGLGVIAPLGFSGSPMLVFLAAVVFLLGRAELAAVRRQEEVRHWQREPDRFYGSADADFSGWQWDAGRRVWTQWVDGRPVREYPAV